MKTSILAGALTDGESRIFRRMPFLTAFLLLVWGLALLVGEVQGATVPTNNQKPLRIVALGDSVVWGQGLQEKDKFYSLVADAIGGVAGVEVSKANVAHSGAVLGVNLPISTPIYPGEIPNPFPTILAQCETFNDSPETVDLVIIDGGANDIGILSVIDPDNSPDTIATWVRQFCYNDLVTLLKRASDKFSSAKIVVTGYYPGISEQSDLDAVKAVLVGANIAGGSIVGGVVVLFGFDDIRDRVVANCRRFNAETRAHIQAAVTDVNNQAVSRGQPVRVFFADPSFGPENALFAPASWLFGVRTELFPPVHFLSPIDSQAAVRQSFCPLTDCYFWEIDCLAQKFKCQSASFGHPSERGARAYASAIGAALGFALTDFSGTSGGNDRMEFPFHTLGRAIEHVPAGGTILLRPGTSGETPRISKACTLKTWGGPVIIGKK